MILWIHDHLEFHDVEELQPVPGCDGCKLQRIPERVRNRLGAKGHTRGRFYAQWTSGCEIRFVTPGKFFALTLCRGSRCRCLCLPRENCHDIQQDT